MRIKGLKEKNDLIPPPRELWGGVSNFSKVQGDPSFQHNKKEFKVKEFKGFHGSLSFEDLEAFQFQENLKIDGVVVD